MAKDGIRISPKHGVNPTLLLCFWCRTNSVGIALAGRLPHDAEAPRTALTYDPCEQCQKLISSGIWLIEATKTGDENVPPMPGTNAYPTGRWAVISEEGVRAVVNEPWQSELIKKRKAVMEPEVISQLGLFDE